MRETGLARRNRRLNEGLMSRFVRSVRTVLLIALLIVCFVLLVVVARQVVRNFLSVQNARRVQAGEPLGVRPWMTVPYIARTYGVPEEVLFAALALPATPRNRHAPLQLLAAREGQDQNHYVQLLNSAIDSWRRAHPTPARTPDTPRGPPPGTP